MAAFTKSSLQFCTLLVLCMAASVCSQTIGKGIKFCLECGQNTDTPFNFSTVARCVVFKRDINAVNNSIFACECREGFKGDGITCNDFNECLDIKDNNCDNDATCTNTDGSYVCTCNKGYSGAGVVCMDNDECVESKKAGVELCAGNGICTNTNGSYQCTCKSEYQPINNATGCGDFNECLDRKDNNCDNDAICTNTAGSYVCTCNRGYSGTGVVCTDIDECEEARKAGVELCAGNGICTNTKGSYQCTCKPGYQPINNDTGCGDVNECLTNNGGCDQQCINTVGSSTCTCYVGYQFENPTNDNSVCKQVNECDGDNKCDMNADCTDTIGSYTCKCRDGYEGDGYTCADIRDCSNNVDVCHRHGVCISDTWMCECETGYAGNGIQCYDIDECATIPDADKTLCGEEGTCQNKDGSYTCVCNPGFYLKAEGTGCIDVDECSEKSHDCSKYNNTQCLNVYGAAQCVCKPGWTGNFLNCKNINECKARIPPCGEARCTDTDGGFECSCSSGYELNGTSCVDINECERNSQPCDRNADCTNTDGSWQCACNAGYTGTGITCADIDECSEDTDVCDSNADCKNTEGSWTCQCKKGYVGDGTTCYDPKPPVANFNVFKGAEHCVRCGRLSSTNLPYYEISKCVLMTLNYEDVSQSEYRCECLQGFTGDGLWCEDVNECENGGHRCHSNATCTNTKGGHSCKCKDGYKGDGHVCTASSPLSGIIGK